jgi:hypothetical protein
VLPPLFPCGGLDGGVFPVPPEPGALAPPPEPPFAPEVFPPPPPPPADVIELNTEFEPLAPLQLEHLGTPAPPAPTVTGKAVPLVKVNFVPPGNEVL